MNATSTATNAHPNAFATNRPSDENTIFLVASLSKQNLDLLLLSLSIFNPHITLIISAPPHELPLNIPLRKTLLINNESTNYGDAYNQLVYAARDLKPKYLIVLNDDIVVEKDTIQKIYKDYLVAESMITPGYKVGWVAARSNYIRMSQNIRYNWENSIFNGLNFESENKVFQVPAISPVLAIIAYKHWINFAPINWYSDDLQCFDMRNRRLCHFVSTAYCHHFGSQTIGRNHQVLHNQAFEWIKTNRPDFADLLQAVQQ